MTEQLTEAWYDDMGQFDRYAPKSPNIEINCGGDDFQNIIDKLAKYETAEDEGRLVVLPCKVGDTVWMVHQRLTSTVNNVISKMTVTELRGNRLNPIWFVIDGEYGKTSFSPPEIGKTIFLTREEAEKALEEMNRDE